MEEKNERVEREKRVSPSIRAAAACFRSLARSRNAAHLRRFREFLGALAQSERRRRSLDTRAIAIRRNRGRENAASCVFCICLSNANAATKSTNKKKTSNSLTEAACAGTGAALLLLVALSIAAGDEAPQATARDISEARMRK